MVLIGAAIVKSPSSGRFEAAASPPFLSDRAATPRQDGQSPAVSSAPSSEALRISASEAKAIAIVVRFIQLINDGDSRAANEILANDASVSDCDFANMTVVIFEGNKAATRWVAERIADHERLEIGTLFNANPVFDGAIGLVLSNRSNDTLTRLGARAGIAPSLSAKVVVTDDMSHIRTFAMAPGGGDPAIIRAACSIGG